MRVEHVTFYQTMSDVRRLFRSLFVICEHELFSSAKIFIFSETNKIQLFNELD